MADNLRPCPFCGAEAILSSEYTGGGDKCDGCYIFAECTQCRARSTGIYADDINWRATGIKDWQDRFKEQT